jgi:hypothetical protein
LMEEYWRRKLPGGRPMAANRDSACVLDQEFLEMRCKILELAAALDRLDRAPRSLGPPDPRLAQLRQGLEALLEPGPGRAETVQRVFSLEYDPDWMTRFGIAARQDRRR